MGAGQIPKNKERMKGEFLRSYAAGTDDMKDIGLVDIVRVVEGNLKMSKLVYYHHHGGKRSRRDTSRAGPERSETPTKG